MPHSLHVSAARARALPFVYGSTRRTLERWVTSSEDLAIAGMRWFAGERVPKWRIALAAAAMERALAGG